MTRYADLDWKGFAIRSLFRSWRPSTVETSGYAILMPMPEDLPFLLELALAGLREQDLASCAQIVVAPDGRGTDRGAALAACVERFHDHRIEFAPLSRRARWLAPRVDTSAVHWLSIVNALDRVHASHCLLHDADAFFVDRSSIETLYGEIRRRGLVALGIEQRLDPFFRNLSCEILGTWELMFDVAWAKSFAPWEHKGRWYQTPAGPYEFDTMLYPQFRSAASGGISVSDRAPLIAHFSATINTYRAFQKADGRSVIDELFRILLLSLLEDAAEPSDGERRTPRVETLEAGLQSSDARVSYRSEVARREWPAFWELLERLWSTPLFNGPRADAMRRKLEPFRQHFERLGPGLPTGSVPSLRRHGLAI